MNKAVYSLIDASRSFYVNYGTELVAHGLEVCRFDPAVFIQFEDDLRRDSYMRVPASILSMHVDDSLSAGCNNFKEKVLQPIFKKFKHGSSDKLPFTYLGIKMTREKEGLDHDHYVKNLQVPDYTIFKTHMDELLSVEGQKLFRSIAA